MTFETLGVITGTSEPTAVTANSSTNTKGAWVELDASTAVTVDGFWVYAGSNNSTNYDSLVDIGTGAASSETVLIADLLFSRGDQDAGGNPVFFPMSIASGTRLAVRQQCRVSNAVLDIAMMIQDDSNLDVTAYTSCDTIGADTTDSGGTSIDPGGSANTKSSYVELVASSSNNYKALLIAIGQNQNTACATAQFLFDVAIGAAASEVDFLSNIHFSSGGGADMMEPCFIGPIACDIPTSSRISVRGQTTTTDGTDRLFDIVLYGMY